MHFFRSREDAATSMQGREGIVILSIAEANQLAQWHWVDRQRSAEARVQEPALF